MEENSREVQPNSQVQQLIPKPLPAGMVSLLQLSLHSIHNLQQQIREIESSQAAAIQEYLTAAGVSAEKYTYSLQTNTFELAADSQVAPCPN